jgi:hypothetical protein
MGVSSRIPYLTCNPKWPEIQSQLLDGQTAFDCPDVTAPVFKSWLDVMMTNIRNGKYFRGQEVTYTFHVVEYQYRGLPHAHVVICLKDAYDIDADNRDDLISFGNQHFWLRCHGLKVRTTKIFMQKMEHDPSLQNIKVRPWNFFF